jgi:hypothetical protein
MGSAAQLRHERKIQEIREALIAEGLTVLDQQADALGLDRSTAWFILQAKHKKTGISTAILTRILQSPNLPQTVRGKVLQYAAGKAAGFYGHNERSLRLFNQRWSAATEETTEERDQRKHSGSDLKS